MPVQKPYLRDRVAAAVAEVFNIGVVGLGPAHLENVRDRPDLGRARDWSLAPCRAVAACRLRLGDSGFTMALESSPVAKARPPAAARVADIKDMRPARLKKSRRLCASCTSLPDFRSPLCIPLEAAKGRFCLYTIPVMYLTFCESRGSLLYEPPRLGCLLKAVNMGTRPRRR